MTWMYNILLTLTPTTMLWVRATFPLLGLILGTRLALKSVWIMAGTDLLTVFLELTGKVDARVIFATFVVGNLIAVVMETFGGDTKGWTKVKNAGVTLIASLVVAVSVCLMQHLITG